MAEPMATRGPGLGPVLTVDLVDEYLTEKVNAGRIAPHSVIPYRSTLRRFVESTGPKAVDRVTKADVVAFVEVSGIQAATRRRRLVDVRGFFRWLIETDRLDGPNPTDKVQKIRQPRQVPRTMKHEDVTKVLAAATSPRMALMLSLMAYEGLRCCEVSALTVEDIDWADRSMRIRGKGGHERILPISDHSIAALIHYRGPRPVPGPVIRSGSATTFLYKPQGPGLSPQGISINVLQHMRRCGVNGSAHKLRHTMAANMLKAGANVRDVQAALGHSNLAITSRYLQYDVGDLREAMFRSHQSEPEPAAPAEVDTLIDVVANLAARLAELEAANSVPPERPYFDDGLPREAGQGTDRALQVAFRTIDLLEVAARDGFEAGDPEAVAIAKAVAELDIDEWSWRCVWQTIATALTRAWSDDTGRTTDEVIGMFRARHNVPGNRPATLAACEDCGAVGPLTELDQHRARRH